MDVAVSKNNVPVRIPHERWHPITTGHPEIADFYFEILETIEDPVAIYKGKQDALIAVSNKDERTGKFIVVVYKETGENDGFIITAFLSNKEQKFKSKELLWKK